MIALVALDSLAFFIYSLALSPTLALDIFPAVLDPHSYAASGPLRVGHLCLVLTIDFTHHTLVGTATWLLTELALHSSDLVLDTRELLVESVCLGDAVGGPAAAYYASAS